MNDQVREVIVELCEENGSQRSANMLALRAGDGRGKASRGSGCDAGGHNSLQGGPKWTHGS
jgi:hypothetical protein